jgi:hypothetical protein
MAGHGDASIDLGALAEADELNTAGMGQPRSAEASVKGDVGSPVEMQGAAGGGGSGGGGSGGGGGNVVEAVPEGRLAAGGEDAQAAVAADAGSTLTSDSTAERVAQVHGLGPEAEPGMEEAASYAAEAEAEQQQGDNKSA